MKNLSLNPIFEGLTPIFKQLKTAAMSAFLVFPVALNVHAKSVETKSVQIFTVQKIKISTQDEQAFYQFADNAVNLVQVTSALTDFAISFVPQAFEAISMEEVLFLEDKANEYDRLIAAIFADMAQFGLTHPLFVSELNNLSNKMHHFCNMMKSEKYKQQSDQVVLSRLYNGKESVGYSFNKEHSFDDFKRAMLS